MIVHRLERFGYMRVRATPDRKRFLFRLQDSDAPNAIHAIEFELNHADIAVLTLKLQQLATEHNIQIRPSPPRVGKKPGLRVVRDGEDDQEAT
jgi:hypothetical protein